MKGALVARPPPPPPPLHPFRLSIHSSYPSRVRTRILSLACMPHYIYDVKLELIIIFSFLTAIHNEKYHETSEQRLQLTG